MLSPERKVPAEVPPPVPVRVRSRVDSPSRGMTLLSMQLAQSSCRQPLKVGTPSSERPQFFSEVSPWPSPDKKTEHPTVREVAENDTREDERDSNFSSAGDALPDEIESVAPAGLDSSAQDFEAIRQIAKVVAGRRGVPVDHVVSKLEDMFFGSNVTTTPVIGGGPVAPVLRGGSSEDVGLLTVAGAWALSRNLPEIVEVREVASSVDARTWHPSTRGHRRSFSFTPGDDVGIGRFSTVRIAHACAIQEDPQKSRDKAKDDHLKDSLQPSTIPAVPQNEPTPPTATTSKQKDPPNRTENVPPPTSTPHDPSRRAKLVLPRPGALSATIVDDDNPSIRKTSSSSSQASAVTAIRDGSRKSSSSSSLRRSDNSSLAAASETNGRRGTASSGGRQQLVDQKNGLRNRTALIAAARASSSSSLGRDGGGGGITAGEGRKVGQGGRRSGSGSDVGGGGDGEKDGQLGVG